MTEPPLRLYTFALSHFSEKTRFMLDATRTPYEEVTWTPLLHVAPALLKSRRATTVPILEVGDEVIQDSTRILLWLERNRAPFPLLPPEGAERDEVLALEDRFDRVGNHMIRYAYSVALDEPANVANAWTDRSSALVKRAVGAAFPLVVPVIKNRFEIVPEKVARSREVIAEGVAFLEDLLRDGRRYLVGDRLTAADVTAAALLAPIACPDEHAIYAKAEYRESVRRAREPMEGPGLEWVRETYRRERRRDERGGAS